MEIKEGLCGCRWPGPISHFSSAKMEVVARFDYQESPDILPGLKFSRMSSLVIASCFAKLSGKLVKRNVMNYAVHVLSAFRFPQIDGNTLFVPSDASESRTHSIYIKLSPHT